MSASDPAELSQPVIAGVPAGNTAPISYGSAAFFAERLSSYWSLTPQRTVTDGIVLTASMALDEEGPFNGVKADPAQERQWPRTFKDGWPNIIASPTPVMIAITFPGVWPLDYELVIPQQVVDWVALECYRMCELPFEQGIDSESVTGASVKYAQPDGKSPVGQLERIQAALLVPWQLRQGHTNAFTLFNRV